LPFRFYFFSCNKEGAEAIKNTSPLNNFSQFQFRAGGLRVAIYSGTGAESETILALFRACCKF